MGMVNRKMFEASLFRLGYVVRRRSVSLIAREISRPSHAGCSTVHLCLLFAVVDACTNMRRGGGSYIAAVMAYPRLEDRSYKQLPRMYRVCPRKAQPRL